MGTTLHLLVIVSTEEEENETFCTWPPLVIEKILDVPPHCLTYHRNQRAETWWGSDVTLTFTKTVAKSLTALHETQEQKETVRKYDFLTAFRILFVILNKGCFPKVRKVKVIYICLIFQSVVRLFKWVSTSTSLPPKAFTRLVWNTTDFTSVKEFPSCYSFHQNKYFSQEKNIFGNLLVKLFCISPLWGAHQAHRFQGLMGPEGLK